MAKKGSRHGLPTALHTIPDLSQNGFGPPPGAPIRMHLRRALTPFFFLASPGPFGCVFQSAARFAFASPSLCVLSAFRSHVYCHRAPASRPVLAFWHTLSTSEMDAGMMRRRAGGVYHDCAPQIAITTLTGSPRAAALVLGESLSR